MAVETEQRTSLVLERKIRSLEHVLLSNKGIHQRELDGMVLEGKEIVVLVISMARSRDDDCIFFL